MEEEIKIAKANIEVSCLEHFKVTWEVRCKEHKQSCERFLKFLESLNPNGYEYYEIIEKRIEDLEKAIKLYSENKI